MNVRQLRISRRSITIAAALGRHGVAGDRRPCGAEQAGAGCRQGDRRPSRAATPQNGLADRAGDRQRPLSRRQAPLTQPINDARALTAALRRNGFDVDVVEDASKDDMTRAIDRLKSRIRPDSVVMLFFGGYGVQVGRESYMIPVDATIWKEADVRRDGVSVESVLEAMKEQGARAKLVVIDASRRNPYERRFRTFSHGLAPINAPDNALILSSATPGKVADDGKGQYSVLVTELLNNLERARLRRRDRLQQDPRRDLPRLRRRAGARRCPPRSRRRPLRRHRKRRRLRAGLVNCSERSARTIALRCGRCRPSRANERLQAMVLLSQGHGANAFAGRRPKPASLRSRHSGFSRSIARGSSDAPPLRCCRLMLRPGDRGFDMDKAMNA